MSQYQRICRPALAVFTPCVLLVLLIVVLLMGWQQTGHAQLIRGVYDGDRVDDSDVDRRITWLHWWEANRDDYLMAALRNRDKIERKEPFDTERLSRSVNTLIEVTRLDDKDSSKLKALRVAATLSLGKIGTDEAIDRLIELMQDKRGNVRSMAWLALGVSGHARAREVLLEATPISEDDRLARDVAMGLLKPGDSAAIELLKRELVELPNESQKRIALQSLRLLRAGEIADIGYEVLKGTVNENLASEAVLAMATRPQPDQADLILSLLNGGPPASRLPIGALDDTDDHLRPGGYTTPTRFAAAMVLGKYEGMFPIHRLERVLSKHVFRTTPSGEGDYYRGVALLSLVPMIEPDDETVLFDALDGRTRVFDYESAHVPLSDGPVDEREFNRRYDPLRGYAAIGMGLYLKHIRDTQPAEPDLQRNPVRYEHEAERAQRRMLDQLSRTLENQRVLNDLRCAAAIGLALSDEPEAVDLLKQGQNETEIENVMLMGYSTLALALLGDKDAAIPARRYLLELSASRNADGFSNKYDLEQTMGMRVMALALGLIGTEEDASTLIKAWGADPWVSLEIARALNWLEDDSLSESLIELIRKDPDDADAVLAAMSLGELYESNRPSKLSRLVAGCNYTINDSGIAPANVADPEPRNRSRDLRRTISRWQSLNSRIYQSPANVFLYEVMLQESYYPYTSHDDDRRIGR